MPRKKKTYRRANGEGTIYNLGGKRRKPWVAKVFAGMEFDPNKKSKKKVMYYTIGYYETKEEATFALLEYNKNPASVEFAKQVESITFGEVYEEWLSHVSSVKSEKTIKGYMFARLHCKDIEDCKIKNLRSKDFQVIIDKCKLSPSAKIKIKSLMYNVCKFAEMNDYVNKNYASFIHTDYVKTSTLHKPFSKEEIDLLWENIDIPFVDTILIMIYTGFRINELLEMENEKNIDVHKKVMIGGFKTEAGTDRIVPIHSLIYPYVLKRYDEKEKYFIRNKRGNNKMSYQNYRNNYFDKIMIKLKMDHLPHDCRHTFATLLNNAEVNGTSITKLIGHASFSFTEKVYTHKDVDELRKAIECI